MNTAIPLLQTLLHSLDQATHHPALAAELLDLGVPSAQLLQARDSKPYLVSVDSHGLDLMMQCVNPEAAEEQRCWGLQSFTLHGTESEVASAWHAQWPHGIDPNHATAASVAQVFEADPEASLITPSMLCFTTPGVAGQPWSVVCLFDDSRGALKTMSLARGAVGGEWVLGAQP